MQKRHGPEPAYDPKGSWMYISVIGVVALVMVAVVITPYFRERSERKRASWPQTKGTPTGTRIIKEPPTPRFPIAIYIGQCSVDYTVAGKGYSLWAGAGYVDRDSKWIADRMQECPIAHYVVHYNPRDRQTHLPNDSSSRDKAPTYIIGETSFRIPSSEGRASRPSGGRGRPPLHSQRRL
jgi:hypothetical protein